MKQVRGGCLCGSLRIVATGPPDRVGMCHCIACRKHHGAVFYAAAIYPADAVEIEGAYAAFDDRCFCPRCGGSVFARSAGEVEVHLGCLDDPGLFEPEYELWTVRREPWLPGVPGTICHLRDRETG
ncbi:GFA family protein [uncultured Tateyamaria sp.]|uniref:GFA family protein n=1 Tax=Tateyamaria sp. 1078 TaxID=3417464 RepID=UPI002613F40B|nr:GFA family protein [uncultured Tateyamaria sp.]